ncbi:MAG: ATP-dependent Clp protease proteolytic subunit, partial [Clostridia bacterium]|nr:ATP-dependent Clp protease proteolytic subunit [Clostridia bacterium]
IMIHQPLTSGVQGQATDIKIRADHIIRARERINRFLCETRGQTMEVMDKATDRDNFMSAQEALEFGLIDKIIDKR